MAVTLEPRAFEHLLLDFLAYLEFERGLSRNTLEAYRSDLLQFGAFLSRRGVEAPAAQHADLSAFLSELATGGPERAPVAPATLQRKAACLRTFYRHLRRESIIDHDPTAAALASTSATRSAAAIRRVRRRVIGSASLRAPRNDGSVRCWVVVSAATRIRSRSPA